MAKINDPRSKMLSSDEETVEIVEIIEDCVDYSDLDVEDENTFAYDYDAEF